MMRSVPLEHLREQLSDVKCTMNTLYPMIACCKDALNSLTLQELAIRTAMRLKKNENLKTEPAETQTDLPIQQFQEVVVNTDTSQFYEPEEVDIQPSNSTQGQTDTDLDYKEFLYLDPNLLKYSSGEEEDEGQDDLSECDVRDILLSDCNEEDSDSD